MLRAWLVALLAVGGTAGCSFGGGDDGASTRPPSRPALTGAQAHAGASLTSATLTQIADGPAAQRRLGYLAVEAIGEAELPFSERELAARVLGKGARVLRSLPSGAARSAVQVGASMTVLRGDGVGGIDGRPSGDDGVVVGADAAAADALADPRPQTSAITPGAQSAVQSCLGDTLAQTILGPATMGDDAALGAGIAESADQPAGLQLRLCGAPKYIRHIHAMERRLERRFGHLGKAAVIEEREIGEREIIAGVVPATELASRQVLALLAGGRELRSLAWR